jgi:myosin-5
MPTFCCFQLLAARRLTNTVTLLHMLHKNVKPASGSQLNRRPQAASARSVFGNLFGRANPSPGLAHAEASIHGGGVGEWTFRVETGYLSTVAHCSAL